MSFSATTLTPKLIHIIHILILEISFNRVAHKDENIPSSNAERKEQRKSLFLDELYTMLSPFTYFIYAKSALYHRAYWDGGDVLYLLMSKMVLIRAISNY